MDKYLQAEKELAELFGWTGIRKHCELHTLIGQPPKKKLQYLVDVPKWTKDDGEAFRLAVEHNITPNSQIHPTYVTVMCWQHFPNLEIHIAERVADHPNKLTAVRYAIVQSVIAKLKKAQNSS